MKKFVGALVGTKEADIIEFYTKQLDSVGITEWIEETKERDERKAFRTQIYNVIAESKFPLLFQRAVGRIKVKDEIDELERRKASIERAARKGPKIDDGDTSDEELEPLSEPFEGDSDVKTLKLRISTRKTEKDSLEKGFQSEKSKSETKMNKYLEAFDVLTRELDRVNRRCKVHTSQSMMRGIFCVV